MLLITIIHAGTSPVSVTDLSQGLHHYKVLPQGCGRGGLHCTSFQIHHSVKLDWKKMPNWVKMNVVITAFVVLGELEF